GDDHPPRRLGAADGAGRPPPARVRVPGLALAGRGAARGRRPPAASIGGGGGPARGVDRPRAVHLPRGPLAGDLVLGVAAAPAPAPGGGRGAAGRRLGEPLLSRAGPLETPRPPGRPAGRNPGGPIALAPAGLVRAAAAGATVRAGVRRLGAGQRR